MIESTVGGMISILVARLFSKTPRSGLEPGGFGLGLLSRSLSGTEYWIVSMVIVWTPVPMHGEKSDNL